MSDLHPAAVATAWDETRELRGVRLEVPAEVRATHRLPGQYLKVRAGDKEGYLALASAPGKVPELLVKRGGALGDAIAALEGGAPVSISDAQGKGYPVEENAGRDLLLFAAGSGITPIRALLDHVIAHRPSYGRVLLFYGHRAPGDFAYQQEHATWTAAGIELIKVVSRPDGTDWSGATGHVQDALLARKPPVERATAFLCGMKGMVAGVTAALESLGLDKQRIFLNY
jgi:sulfhydrogenase subunit gamma (sulfur reductase)